MSSPDRPTGATYNRFLGEQTAEATEVVAKQRAQGLTEAESRHWLAGQDRVIDAVWPYPWQRFAIQSAYDTAITEVFSGDTSSSPPTLNAEQESAVRAITTTPGLVTCRAGAGSGKTRVLTEAARQLARSEDINGVCCITFTNRSTDEMRQRLGSDGEHIWISTIHSLAARRLQRWREKDGLPLYQYWRGADVTRLLAAWAEPSQRTGAYATLDYPPLTDDQRGGLRTERLAEQISAVWNETSPEHAHMSPFAREFAPVLDAMMLANGLWSPDQMVPLLERELLAGRSLKFDAVLVDEAQDLNPAQRRLVEMIYRRTLACVGDPRQSIYSFRGSQPAVFDELWDASDARCELLNNHRSERHLVDWGNRTSAKMGYPTLNVVKGDTNGSPKVDVRHFGTPREEARFWVRRVQDKYRRDPESIRDVAFLVRTHRDAAEIVEELERLRIPFAIRGSTIKAIMEYPHARRLHALVGVLLGRGTDTSACYGLEYLPGIGPAKALKRVRQGEQMTFWTGSDDIALPPVDPAEPAVDVLQRVIALNPSPNAMGTTDPVRLLASAEGLTVDEWYTEVHLAQEARESEHGVSAVTISTVHAAKGLEWPVVVLPCCTDARYPIHMAVGAAQVAEERRVFYVAVTRAQRRLFVSSVLNHQRGRDEIVAESQYIKEG